MLLLLLAVILAIILFPVGFLWSAVSLKFRIKAYARAIAFSIDQTGNVVLQDLFNSLLITKDGYKFGNEDETISDVLNENFKRKTLTKTGVLLVELLNWLDPGHIKI